MERGSGDNLSSERFPPVVRINFYISIALTTGGCVKEFADICENDLTKPVFRDTIVNDYPAGRTGERRLRAIRGGIFYKGKEFYGQF